MQLENISVLVIDDEHIIVDILTTYLENNGFNVTGLTDPQEALKYIEKEAYDIVLTDLMMPKVSGMDVMKTVKQTGRDTEVIIFTGFASIDSAIEAIQYGVYDYIRKPIELKEIKAVIDRAAEKLFLRRENVALNKKIEKMFSDITMLYDISSILYQVFEFDIAVDMILDTLTEGMKIEKVGIFLFDELSGDFVIKSARGLTDEFIDQFRFKIGDTINHSQVRDDQSIVLSKGFPELTINGREIAIGDNQNHCIMVPIHYQEKLYGFIGIFQINEQIYSLEDEVKLLEILATQIAPIFQSVGAMESLMRPQNVTYDKILYTVIKDKIISSIRANRSVSFALLRLIKNPESTDLPPLSDLESAVGAIIRDEFETNGEIIWHDLDSMLIVLPGWDTVSTELACANIRRKVEEYYSEKSNIPLLSIKYAIVTCPTDGKSADTIINGLGTKLFQEIWEPLNQV